MDDTNLPPVTPTTDPEKDPTEERKNSFVKEYGELVAKHGVDFASYPVFVPDGQGGFKVVVQNTPVDIKNQPQKSPFVAQ
jgi:hypothetical protein